MKRYKKLLAILPFAAASFGCSDSFFTNTPQDTLDPSKLGVEQLNGLLNAIYTRVGGSYNAFQDGFADNGYSRNAWDSYGKLIQTNTISSGANFESDDFGYANAYSAIRVCNLLIKYSEEIAGVADEVRANYKAQARVVRAFNYMKLSLYFGDVPFVTGVTNDFGLEGIAQTSKEEIRKWVLSELDEAITVLPEGKVRGRITRGVAYAIKARAAYYFGEYAVARDAARWVIDNGGYSLHTVDYTKDESMKKDAAFFAELVDFNATGINKNAFINGIFSYEDLFQSDNNNEVILVNEYLPTETYGDWQRVTCYMTPNMTGMQAWNTMAPIQQLVDAYWSIDGKTKPALPSVANRQTAYIKLKSEIDTISARQKISYNEAVKTIANELTNRDYLQQFKNRDSRMYASIVFPFAAINKYRTGFYQEYIQSIGNFGETGFAWRKLASLKEVVPAWGGYYYTSGLDFPLIRLAEMLLIYAEAETQVKGYDASVEAELNKLRERCGMPNVPSGLGKNAALDFIRKERRIELAAEGLRFLDIRLYEDETRNGGYKGEEAASKVMAGSISDPVAKRSDLVWAKRLMYLPIPTSSMDKNSALKQNEGY